MSPVNRRQLWGIVLAGGEGTRVRDFLTQLCGGRGIKQFCAVIGRRSMLEHTLARVERLIPRERILVIVSRDHHTEAAPQLADWPTDNVIFQPANRDTAPGLLLPLAHISHRDPFATVAVFPSDHCIVQEEQFMACVQQAVVETQRFPGRLTLLGITPDRVEEGYGWIEPAGREAGRMTQVVRRFWEKPSLSEAHTLLRRGVLWNTFVFVAQAHTVWTMAQEATPALARDFAAIRCALRSPQAGAIIESIYRTMDAVNFSSAICTPLASYLRVLPVPDVGWSDWGTVERILISLRELGKLDECIARLRHREKTASAAATFAAEAKPAQSALQCGSHSDAKPSIRRIYGSTE